MTERGLAELVYPELWQGCVLATLGPQQGIGSRAWDYSGRNNHGTLTNGPVWQKGTYRGQAFQGLLLDGVNDYMSVLNVPQFSNTSPCALVSWVRPIATGVTAGVITRWNTNVTAGWQFNIVGGKPAFSMLKALAIDYWVATGSVAVTTDWQCIAINYSGSGSPSGVTHFRNGIATASDAPAVFGNGNPGVLATPEIMIGRRAASSSPLQFAGQIGPTFLWTRQLTASEQSILGRHPIAAYECRPLPRVFAFSGLAKHWLWSRRSQTIGGGTI